MNIAEAVWSFLTDPNVAYLLLILGLWALLLAIFTPGTGISEGVAVVALALAFLGLSRLPVNAAGLVLIAVAFGLFVADAYFQSHGLLTLSGAVALFLGSFFLFQPEGVQGVQLSIALIGAVTMGSVAFFAIAVSAAMRLYRLPPHTGAFTVLGMEGTVRDPLDPIGTVQLPGELWSAKADEPIDAGETVVVDGLEGLTVHVKRKT
jgi:membrane-bound serine protease (ClpP class)